MSSASGCAGPREPEGRHQHPKVAVMGETSHGRPIKARLKKMFAMCAIDAKELRKFGDYICNISGDSDGSGQGVFDSLSLGARVNAIAVCIFYDHVTLLRKLHL